METVKTSGARSALLAAFLAALALMGSSFANTSTASAAQVEFCNFTTVAAGNVCLEGTFRKVTRVNAKSINNSVCAGAYNSSGVQVGGWTCTGEGGETSNGNYDGSKFLKGAILNNFWNCQTLGGGLEYYNP